MLLSVSGDGVRWRQGSALKAHSSAGSLQTPYDGSGQGQGGHAQACTLLWPRIPAFWGGSAASSLARASAAGAPAGVTASSARAAMVRSAACFTPRQRSSSGASAAASPPPEPLPPNGLGLQAPACPHHAVTMHLQLDVYIVCLTYCDKCLISRATSYVGLKIQGLN